MLPPVALAVLALLWLAKKPAIASSPSPDDK